MSGPIDAPETVGQITHAVAALLAGFDADQRAKASFDFADEAERRSWAYFPREFRGLPLRDMNGAQQTLVWRLIEAALSLHAHAKATAIIALETVLGRIERHQRFVRDPGLYFFSVFGGPGDRPWGFRFEGHHVCLNYTFAGGRYLAPTPLFLGSNPAELRRGDAIISRPLGEEEDAARALLASLDRSRRQRAIVAEVAPLDIVLRNAPRVPDVVVPGSVPVPALVQVAEETLPDHLKPLLRYDRHRPIGIAGADMSASQKALLHDLLSVYFERLPQEAARAAEGRALANGIDAVWFAWAGETEPRRPHYYRIQGPHLLIEYDNTQNGANHVHSVWRDPEDDFGDLLLDHYAREHIRAR